MILLLLVSISTCFVPSLLQLQCPSCSNDCGERGYMICDDECGCAPSCDDWSCSGSMECVLEETLCDKSPCALFPTCIDFSNACKEGQPLSTEHSPVLCDDTIRCPLGYTCSEVNFHSVSVCCRNTSEWNDYDDVGPPPLIPNPPPNPSEPEDDACKQCDFDLCDLTICRAHPEAHCVSVECGCESYYVDGNGDTVDCLASDDILPPPFLFRPNFNLDTEPPLSSKSPPKTMAPTTTKHSHKPVNNLGSHDAPSGYDDFTIHVIIGCITALLVIVIVVISCKIYRERKKRPTPPDEEDQRKPLQMSNGEKPPT